MRALYFPDGPDGNWHPGTYALDLPSGLAGDGANRPLLAALAPVISRGVWRFLVRNGGYRRGDVVVAGRRRTGRMWEPAIWGDTHLSIGPSTVAWLAVLHDHFVAGALRGQPDATVIAHAAALEPGPADRLAVSIALLPLARDESRDQLPPVLRALSQRFPLLGLGAPSLLAEPPRWSLEAPVDSLVLQYLDEWIAGGWVRQLSFRRRRSAPAQAALDGSLAAAFDGLFGAADPGERDHLLVPFTRFFPLLWREAGGDEGLSSGIERIAATLPGLAEREALLRGFGAVLGTGERLDARVDAIGRTPWADRTESQKRLLAGYEAHYRPLRDPVRSLARRLRRELG